MGYNTMGYNKMGYKQTPLNEKLRRFTNTVTKLARTTRTCDTIQYNKIHLTTREIVFYCMYVCVSMYVCVANVTPVIAAEFSFFNFHFFSNF